MMKIWGSAMKKESLKRKIESVDQRKILNSHAQFTTEFVVELDDGTIGVGSSPRGETTSIYEKDKQARPRRVIERLHRDRILDTPVSQVEFDAYLQRQTKIFGRANCYALSLAFFDAYECSRGRVQDHRIGTKSHFPHICLNILNGSHHAYTNPVLSEFHEFLLIPKSIVLHDIISEHNELQTRIKEKLATCDKTVVSGNVVNKLGAADNRVWLELLLSMVDDMGLASKYDLMIDASAGDLWTGRGYRFSLTDRSLRTPSEMCDYWTDLIDAYRIKFLEDPFHERDFESWVSLSRIQRKCKIIGNNLYSSDPERIREGAIKRYTHGVIIMPDQTGTVSATIEAIETARDRKQIVMTSHRSISTESTFLSVLTNRYNVDYIKIGPLFTDYSAVIRLNELIRLSGMGHD